MTFRCEEDISLNMCLATLDFSDASDDDKRSKKKKGGKQKKSGKQVTDKGNLSFPSLNIILR